jgi:sulfide:quinone oxidoreductase
MNLPRHDRRHHRVVIIGGGTAGITVAARLVRKGEADIALIEPSPTHCYQPLLTLVGGGRVGVKKTLRAEGPLLPKAVEWVMDAAEEIDPHEQVVTTRDGARIGYDFLVVCPGIQLNWAGIPGLPDTLGRNGVSSNYTPALAPTTWEMIRRMRRGTAVFMAPSGPTKCGGAPQKIAYLAADHWRREGVLGDIDVKLVLPGEKIFGVPEYAEPLLRVVERYGIDLRLQSEVVAVDPDQHTAVINDLASGTKHELGYDFMHVVPPQSAPDWIKSSPLAGADPRGWITVDKATLQHTTYPNVFALGDVVDVPTGKTGAAVRKQAPVVVENLLAVAAGKTPPAVYHGYSSCPIVTARNRMLLCEFDYDMRPAPSIPLMHAPKERYSMWLLKRYGLPFLYWHLMLHGRA